jgi:hypothetical protein
MRQIDNHRLLGAGVSVTTPSPTDGDALPSCAPAVAASDNSISSAERFEGGL